MLPAGTLKRAAVFSSCVSAWGLALYAALNVARLNLRWEHGICGPWGCGPPPEALAACHLFWLALLTPPAWLLGARLSRSGAQRVGWTLTGLGVLGLAGVVFHEMATWLSPYDDWHCRYFAHRCLFAVATLIEIPIAEILALGLAISIAARAQRPCQVPVDRVPNQPP
jgi:hypothetical protein